MNQVSSPSKRPFIVISPALQLFLFTYRQVAYVYRGFIYPFNDFSFILI